MTRFSLCVALALCGWAISWSWGETSADGQAPSGKLDPDAELWYGASTNPIPGISTAPQGNYRDYEWENIQKLMGHLGVGIGSTNDVCRSWEAPDEILIGRDRYDVRIAMNGGFSVAPRGTSNEAARCYMVQYANARSACKSEFGCRLGGRRGFSPLPGPNRKPWEVRPYSGCSSAAGWSRSMACHTVVLNVDPATNAFFIASKDGGEKFDALVYKNLVLSISAPSNAMEIALALMNAGLPEDERIVR